MPYTYDWPRPAVTLDAVVLTAAEPRSVLLIRRKHPPFEGSWALPGGFLEMEEELETGARRELEEETGVSIPEVPLEQIGTYGKVGRDPRSRTISIVFAGLVPDPAPAPQARDDAADARWWPVSGLPPLAFDHGEIIADGLAWLARRGRK
jgi:8-oxo-dGTP diphosphatase